MGSSVYWYSVCAVILFAKMFALSTYQGVHRLKDRSFKNHEDAKFFAKLPLPEDLPRVRRAAQAWLNDLENIPAFFGLGAAYILTGASPAAAPWLFMIFTLARVSHSITYLLRLQPWRTLSYAIGIFCLFGMCASILSSVLEV